MTVRASPAIGLMADESTDISVTKELILYARTLNKPTFKYLGYQASVVMERL